jgi:hypothetical protein
LTHGSDGLVEQLDRLGYETGLALRVIAVQDAWDLANKGDISTEDARESAQDDNCKAAKARLEMAKAEGFITAMGGLQMGEENMEFGGEQKPKYFWRGVLSGSGTNANGYAAAFVSEWIGAAMHDAEIRRLENGIDAMELVSDEQMQELEDLLA